MTVWFQGPIGPFDVGRYSLPLLEANQTAQSIAILCREGEEGSGSIIMLDASHNPAVLSLRKERPLPVK